jgi:hypothetical protein
VFSEGKAGRKLSAQLFLVLMQIVERQFPELRYGLSQAAREKFDGIAVQMAKMLVNELCQARGAISSDVG